MPKRTDISSILVIGAALFAATPASAERIASFLPAEPVALHVDRGDGGGCEEVYFMAVTFQFTGSNPDMLRVAQQAEQAYAFPGALTVAGEGDDADSVLRIIDVKDPAGLLRFVKSIQGNEQLEDDVMVDGLPKDLRFSSVEEQGSGYTEYYISEVAELGAPVCQAAGN